MGALTFRIVYRGTEVDERGPELDELGNSPRQTNLQLSAALPLLSTKFNLRRLKFHFPHVMPGG